MKVTVNIPDELYRRVKAKSAIEGWSVRDVTATLYRDWLAGQAGSEVAAEAAPAPSGKPDPEWFGVLRTRIRRNRNRYDMESVRASIARGRGRESPT